MRASLFYLPTVGSRADIEQGMAGLRPELYQQMRREPTGQARLGDRLGYHSISFTEHHFHVEGFELFATEVVPRADQVLEAPGPTVAGLPA